MKKLIFKKFAKDIFQFFLLVSISISLIVWVIQAVNFLDLVTEDGHAFTVYFLYSFLVLSKVLTKLIPFCPSLLRYVCIGCNLIIELGLFGSLPIPLRGVGNVMIPCELHV